MHSKSKILYFVCIKEHFSTLIDLVESKLTTAKLLDIYTLVYPKFRIYFKNHFSWLVLNENFKPSTISLTLSFTRNSSNLRSEITECIRSSSWQFRSRASSHFITRSTLYLNSAIQYSGNFISTLYKHAGKRAQGVVLRHSGTGRWKVRKIAWVEMRSHAHSGTV